MMKQMLKRTGALFLTLCLILSVWGVLTPLPASAAYATSGDYEYRINDDNTATITKYLGSGGDVTIPDTLDGYTVTSIGYEAFYYCTGLTSVTIPDSVTEIGDDAFRGCTGLASVTIGSCVTTIGEYAFEDCTKLASVTIPDSVIEIGWGAFWGCAGLASVTIPDGVTKIGYEAFKNCTALTSFTVGKDNSNYSSKDGVLLNKDQTELIQYPCGKTGSYIIPNSVTTIDDFAFYNCTGLTSVTIPNSVTWINRFAFENCTGLTFVTIPDSVTIIGEGAFEYCAGLTSITIPNSVTSIGNYAFDGCTGLISIVVGANNPSYSSKDGVWFNKDQTELVRYPEGKSGSYTIPNNVTEIDYRAFYGCTGLISVIIPNSVTEIGVIAFYGCTGLTSIDIPDSVATIGNYAFSGCTGLTSITVGANNPSYSSKDGVWFNKNQTELILCPKGKSGSYTIPDSVTEIDAYAFDSCTSLTSVDIPNSVTKTGDWVFSGCTGLTSITIPDSVTEIGSSTFRGCTGLASIDIPDSVTTIGSYAFEDCTGLTSVDIPDSVTEIGGNAFYGCKNLTIYGKVGSYAETYAKANGIPFGTKVKNQETGIMVEGTAETLPDNAVLNAKQTASGEDTATYEITLTQNGQPIQPTGEVTVKIPLPESMKDQRITVYRIEANGSRTNMNATVQNGCAVFITDHFSQYVLEASDALLGDIDGDGKVSVTDALAILRMAVGLSTPVDNADMDGMNGVTVTDALAALRIAVGLA